MVIWGDFGHWRTMDVRLWTNVEFKLVFAFNVPLFNSLK